MIRGWSANEATLGLEVPSASETTIFPLVAPAGTTAVIVFGETTVTVAGSALVPLNFTTGFVPPMVRKPAPLIVTSVPGELAPVATPCVGRNVVTRGGIVNGEPQLALPPTVVTVSVPVVAPSGTRVSMCRWPGSTVNVAGTPLKVTELTPLRPVPSIPVNAPARAVPGETFVIVGVTEYVPAVVYGCDGLLDVVTTTLPVAAAGGTVTCRCEASTGLKVGALTPPIVTD